VRERGGKVMVECQPTLARLLARCPGVDCVVPRGERIPDFDVHAPLLSLPSIFHTTLDNLPADVPYLFAQEESIERWRNELSGDEGFKVGIAWQGNPQHKQDHFRSIPFERFEMLADVPHVRLHSLQIGAGRERLAQLTGQLRITDLAERLVDFDETAAVVKNLDLVICCDSSLAHLAGALGVPVWVAIPAAPDWRWLVAREDSPWYATMRLFRQTRLGDWESVFARMAGELKHFVQDRRPHIKIE
jgi:ADP-heptose:LPS heptosyltransferase